MKLKFYRYYLKKSLDSCGKIFIIGCFSVFLLTCKNEPISDPTVPDVTQDVYTNGTVIKYRDNGDPKKRVNMVFIGEGFALADQMSWKFHVDDMLNAFFSSTDGEPFGRYSKFFNVYRIDMVSKRSGLDLQNRTTPLKGTTQCVNFAAEDCIVDFNLALDAIEYYMSKIGNPEIKLKEVALNSILPNGGNTHWPSRGGSLITYPAWASWSGTIFIHENGHAFGDLADEYVLDPNATYTDLGKQFWEVYHDYLPNVTRTVSPLKWSQWVGYNQPYQGTKASTIGTYEGGLYVGHGIWRPSFDCMMKDKIQFCAVCREKIILNIYSKVRPVDSVRISMPVIFVDLVDPELFKTEWFVDDNKVAASVLSLDLSTLGLSIGAHTVRIEVADKILEHSFTGTYYDWVRKDTTLLKQTVIKNVVL